MRRALTSGAARFAAIAGFLLLLWTSAPVTTQSPAAGAANAPAFLQAGRCYRFSFPITSVPNWKVLEVLDAGWIKAEADVGPASARRQPTWVNTAQIITVRPEACSE